jgi:hypothetical protein
LGAIFVEQTGRFNTVICLVYNNSLTDSALWTRTLSWCKIHEFSQKVGVVSVYVFHAAFPGLPNCKLGWLFVSWYNFIMNNPSNIKKRQQHFWTLDLSWRNFLVVGNWESSIVHFAASFQGRIGRRIFHHLWWLGLKCRLASPKGLGKLWYIRT